MPITPDRRAPNMIALMAAVATVPAAAPRMIDLIAYSRRTITELMSFFRKVSRFFSPECQRFFIVVTFKVLRSRQAPQVVQRWLRSLCAEDTPSLGYDCWTVRRKANSVHGR